MRFSLNSLRMKYFTSLMSKKASLLFALLATVFSLQAQDIVIKGKITDAKTKEPLPYVLLRVAGTMSGTQTNHDGVYNLKLSKEQADKKIVLNFAGYRTDTIEVSKLRKQRNVTMSKLSIILASVTVSDYNKPSKLMEEVVRRIPDNYWCDTMIGTFFFRHYGLTDDSLWLFCEAISDVMRPGYDIQYIQPLFDYSNFDSISLAGNHKRYPLSRLLVYDTMMLKEILGDSNYKENLFVGETQTKYNDAFIFKDMLQKTKGFKWTKGKGGKKLDRHSKLSIMNEGNSESYYLITEVTEKDSTALIINKSDKALIHYYKTTLCPDTLKLFYPLNRLVGGIWYTYRREQYDYAKVGGRYTLTFSMKGSSIGILPPEKARVVGRKMNSKLREVLTNDEFEEYEMWTLTDFRKMEPDFLKSAIRKGVKYKYHDIFSKGDADESFWQSYNTVPLESRIAEKLEAALKKDKR